MEVLFLRISVTKGLSQEVLQTIMNTYVFAFPSPLIKDLTEPLVQIHYWVLAFSCESSNTVVQSESSSGSISTFTSASLVFSSGVFVAALRFPILAEGAMDKAAASRC